MLKLIYDQPIWRYFSENQKDLIREGEYLLEMSEKHEYRFKDYSFLVFPYAKAYEGFLKQLFLDAKFITHLDYVSDHFRVGKFLSPHLINQLGDRSIYRNIQQSTTTDLAKKIWEVWKMGRNQVLHYYPHNTKRLTFEEARDMNVKILNTMILAYKELVRVTQSG